MNKLILISCLAAAQSALIANTCCCPPGDPCAKCAQLWPTRGPDWIITPGAGPCIARGWDAFVTGEFIYWTTRESNLDFAFVESIQNDLIVEGKGNVEHPDWKFEPGFKVGVGLLYEHDGWDLYINYTWLIVRDTKESISIDDPQEQRIVPLGDSDTFPVIFPILFASGNWELDFNVLDAELGRNFFISRYLKLRPYFGLKGTWQDQCFVIKGRDEVLQSVNNNRLHYWGIGIRAGLDSSWHFNQCFSLVGEASITALWENFEVERRSGFGPIGEFPPPNPTLNIKNDFWTLLPILELFLGLRYETWFCCDRYHTSFEGGWELQWWRGQNQFFDLNLGHNCGDLSLNGFTLKFRLDF